MRKTSQFELPYQFGKYTLTEHVGSGGYCYVYKATDPDGKTVAVRILRKESRDGQKLDEQIEMYFNNNCEKLRDIKHPRIANIFDIGREQGFLYNAGEFYQKSLENLLDSEGIKCDTACLYMVHILEGLSVLHDNSIVHGDLKPSNVLVDSECNMHLHDLGSLLNQEDGTMLTTMTIYVCGTRDYMSPEQRDGKSIDRKSDIYSAGVLLYHMLTGKLPNQLYNGQVPKPSTLNTAVPKEIDDLIFKALNYESPHRFYSAQEMIDAIKKIPNHSNTCTNQSSSDTKKSKYMDGMRDFGEVILVCAAIGIGIIGFGYMNKVASNTYNKNNKPVPEQKSIIDSQDGLHHVHNQIVWPTSTPATTPIKVPETYIPASEFWIYTFFKPYHLSQTVLVDIPEGASGKLLVTNQSAERFFLDELDYNRQRKDGGYELFKTTEWSSVRLEMELPKPGKYYMCFRASEPRQSIILETDSSLYLQDSLSFYDSAGLFYTSLDLLFDNVRRKRKLIFEIEEGSSRMIEMFNLYKRNFILTVEGTDWIKRIDGSEHDTLGYDKPCNTSLTIESTDDKPTILVIRRDIKRVPTEQITKPYWIVKEYP